MLINCKLQQDKNIRFRTFSSAFKQLCCDLWKKKLKWAKKSANIFLMPPLHLSLIGSYTSRKKSFMNSATQSSLRTDQNQPRIFRNLTNFMYEKFVFLSYFFCFLPFYFTKKGQFPRASDLRPSSGLGAFICQNFYVFFFHWKKLLKEIGWMETFY